MKSLMSLVLVSILGTFAHADIPPEPFLNVIDLQDANLQQIYLLVPSKEAEVPNGMTEKGAKLYRKILRDGPKVDDSAHRTGAKSALICERREYTGNKTAMPFNKFSCREVLALRMPIPAKDEDLVQLKND